MKATGQIQAAARLTRPSRRSSSQRAQPARLLAMGFRFSRPDLASALRPRARPVRGALGSAAEAQTITFR